MIKINIKLKKRYLILFGILLGVGFIFAFNPSGFGGDPPIMGHSADEIDVIISTGCDWGVNGIMCHCKDYKDGIKSAYILIAVDCVNGEIVGYQLSEIDYIESFSSSIECPASRSVCTAGYFED